MILLRLWLVFPIAAVVGGAVYPFWLMHDVQDWQAGRPDNLLHTVRQAEGLFPAYVVGVLGLIFMLARAVGNRPRRAIVLAAVWCGLGVGLATLAGSNLTVLQDTYNGWQYKRLTPDDYLFWLGARAEEERILGYVEGIFGPATEPEYTWSSMIRRENVWICVMGVLAAGTLCWLRREPWKAVWAVPVNMFLSLSVYVLVVAPWSMLLVWDEFVGDRLLGSVALQLFEPWELSGPSFVYAYVLSMALFATVWTFSDAKRTDAPPPS